MDHRVGHRSPGRRRAHQTHRWASSSPWSRRASPPAAPPSRPRWRARPAARRRCSPPRSSAPGPGPGHRLPGTRALRHGPPAPAAPVLGRAGPPLAGAVAAARLLRHLRELDPVHRRRAAGRTGRSTRGRSVRRPGRPRGTSIRRMSPSSSGCASSASLSGPTPTVRAPTTGPTGSGSCTGPCPCCWMRSTGRHQGDPPWSPSRTHRRKEEAHASVPGRHHGRRRRGGRVRRLVPPRADLGRDRPRAAAGAGRRRAAARRTGQDHPRDHDRSPGGGVEDVPCSVELRWRRPIRAGRRPSRLSGREVSL
jgi:hypothetical protein